MTTVVEQHTDPGHGPATQPRTRAPDAAGPPARALVRRALLPHRPLPRRRDPMACRLGARVRLGDHHAHQRDGHRADRLPPRPRGVRLLALLGLRPADPPEDHSSHGATSWKDYFRINTDHKVIGVQYTGHDVHVLRHRRPAGDVLPGRARRAGAAVLRPQTFNGLVSVHATLMIFTVPRPGVRRASATSSSR